MAKLYFVRHGFTKNNARMAFNGSQSNHDLLPEGKQQAKQLGTYLKETCFASVYASPQIRALETAELIVGENHSSEKRIIQEPLLKEIDFGQWDGVPIVQKEQEEQFKNLKFFPHQYDPTAFGGESYPEVIQRGTAFLKKLELDREENYLIVSHGVTLMTLLQTMKKKALHQIRENGVLDNASLSVMETEDGKDFQELLWNFTDYQK
ncbi:histidine phosphatase family protein [Enterococcus olivae]